MATSGGPERAEDSSGTGWRAASAFGQPGSRRESAARAAERTVPESSMRAATRAGMARRSRDSPRVWAASRRRAGEPDFSCRRVHQSMGRHLAPVVDRHRLAQKRGEPNRPRGSRRPASEGRGDRGPALRDGRELRTVDDVGLEQHPSAGGR